MTPAAYQRAVEGLNATAEKVLAAVPFEAAWTKGQIVGDLRRSGSCTQANVVEACLNNLRGRGLITEPQRDAFRRVQVRQPGARAAQDIEIKTMTNPEPKTSAPAAAPADPLAKFAALATRARGLATEIEEVALEAAALMQQMAERGEKLAQLQSLLKSI